MNKDLTVSITQNDELVLSATITQCGGAPASEYLAAIKLLSNQISGPLDADNMDIDLSVPYVLSDRQTITKIKSSATTAAAWACSGCLALAAVELTNLTAAGDYAFARTALSGEFAESFPALKTIGISTFDRCQFSAVDLSAVESIGPRAFRAGNIKKVWIPKTITITGGLSAVSEAPFIGNENVDLMIYTDFADEAAAYAALGDHFDNISETQKAPVLYNETHDEYLKE